MSMLPLLAVIQLFLSSVCVESREMKFDPEEAFGTETFRVGFEFARLIQANSPALEQPSTTDASIDPSHTPRVRREWRTLSLETRQKVADAFRIMQNTSTLEGRSLYGNNFWNANDLTAFHVCSVVDPRGDQGHFGPHFMTFHRAFVLVIELSMLSVDPSIGALPYHDPTLDAYGGKYYDDPEMGIWTDNFLGTYYTKEEDNWQVKTGLFADWPVAEYTEERYGPDSYMADGSVNRVSTCFSDRWFYPAIPASRNSDTGKLDPAVTEWGAATGSIPSWCSEECKADASQCPLYFRADIYNCNPNTTRTPSFTGFNQRLAGGSSDVIYNQRDFDACANNPEHIESWMEWQNCIEKRIDGICEIRPAKPLLDFVEFEGNHNAETVNNANEFLATAADEYFTYNGGELYNTEFLGNSGQILPGVTRCGNPKGYFDTNRGREFVNYLHAMIHIRVGGEMFDTGTSPNDMGIFFSHHANVDRSNMHYMMYTSEEQRERFYGFPSSQDYESWKDDVGRFPYGTSGPYSTYAMSYCADPGLSYRYTDYNFGKYPWLPGTLLDDVVNAGYPFFDLFPDYDGGEQGYTHRDILYYSDPSRTPYTYDSLEHHYTGDSSENGGDSVESEDSNYGSSRRSSHKSSKRSKKKGKRGGKHGEGRRGQ